MATLDMELVQQLSDAIGSVHVLSHTDPSMDLSAWEVDWRGRSRGTALAVVKPATTHEVSQIVKLCRQAATSIVPQGGNTGLVNGSIPDGTGSQVILSLSRMRAVRDIDADNLAVTVEAGCILQQLHEAVEARGFMFPLSLAAKGSCTIGGNLATNAGGTQVVRYGNARNLCLGLEVVTAEGEIWQGLTGLRKDNTGYDLRDLFIGSEGTLGIITAATLQIYPQPAARLVAWAAVPSAQHLLSLLASARRVLGADLTGFELMCQFTISMVKRHMPQLRIPPQGDSPYYVLLETSDTESEARARARLEQLLEAAMEDGVVVDAMIAESIGQVNALWEIRESVPMASYKEGVMAAHDISLPISAIPQFIGLTGDELQYRLPGVRVSDFGHLGDGNLHYNVHAPIDTDPLHYLEKNEEFIRRIVYDRVTQHGGSFSAEHGIGRLKTQRMSAYKSPVGLALMQAIKKGLDPMGIMNPNVLLPSMK